jgi:hypothetical protein
MLGLLQKNSALVLLCFLISILLRGCNLRLQILSKRARDASNTCVQVRDSHALAEYKTGAPFQPQTASHRTHSRVVCDEHEGARHTHRRALA